MSGAKSSFSAQLRKMAQNDQSGSARFQATKELKVALTQYLFNSCHMLHYSERPDFLITDLELMGEENER